MITKEARHGELTFVTVSDIGANHRTLCLPNQDAAGFACIGGDFVMAVSDGVGSCKMAEAGAKYVVDSAIRLFSEMRAGALPLDHSEMAKRLIAFWRASVGEGPVDDYCATVKSVIKIGRTATLISLGDGMAAITSNGFSLASPPEEAAFTNETSCMSSFLSPERIWIGDFNLDTYVPYAVFCCTDGVANSLVPGKELELVREIEENTGMEELKLELERLIEEIGGYSFDDKTVGAVKYEGKN